MFDAAIQTLNGHWEGKLFDGYPITSSGVVCEHNAQVLESVARHKLFDTFVKSSALRISQCSELQETKQLLQFLAKHCTRSTYQLVFLKCSQASCDHCSTHPVRATRSVGVLRQLRNRLPTPMPSMQRDHHYCTYLESLALKALGKDLLPLDAGLPSGEREHCDECPGFCFTSATDKDRHARIVHGWKRTGHGQPAAGTRVNQCLLDVGSSSRLTIS